MYFVLLRCMYIPVYKMCKNTCGLRKREWFSINKALPNMKWLINAFLISSSWSTRTFKKFIAKKLSDFLGLQPSPCSECISC